MFLSLSAIALTLTGSSFPKLPILKAENSTIAGLILVKYPQNVASQLSAKFLRIDRRVVVDGTQMEFVNQIGSTGWVQYKISTLVDPKKLAESLKANDPNVRVVQPVNRVRGLIAEPNDLDFNAEERREDYVLNFSENDAFFRRCWHLDEVDAMGGWSVWPNQYYTAATKPTNVPTIAVLDSGCDMDHPDFINAGGAGTNTTQGGQIDKARSVKIRNVQVVSGGDPTDGNGHGTHVAGLALAAGNNGGFNDHGTIGTGYACKGMIYNVLDANGSGSDSDVAYAIIHAADNGADIINLSLGGENFSQVLQDAVVYATEKGSVVVCAGNEDGNGGGDLGPIYPAACSGSLGVTANGPDYTHASYAGFGYYVDLGAPGGDFKQEGSLGGDFVLKLQFNWSTGTTYPNYISINQLAAPPYTMDFTYLPGTSMATPVVAGALGHYFAKNNLRQGNWNNIRAYRAAQRSAYHQGAALGGWEPSNGYGAFNFTGLMNDLDERGATIGGVEGIVYVGGTPVPNTQVRANPYNPITGVVNTSQTYSTTTIAGGMYRFDGMPAGHYRIRTAPFGNLKDAFVKVVHGSDRSGVDFYAGAAWLDSTTPTVVRCNVSNVTSTGITVDHFAYDTETRLFDCTFAVETAAGSLVVAPRRIFRESNIENFDFNGSSLAPGDYKLVARYINGEAMVETKEVPFTIGTALVPVSGVATLQRYTGSGAHNLSFEIRTPGSTTSLESHSFNCVNGTNFTLNTSRRGIFDIAVKGGPFLRSVIRNVNITNSGASGLTVSLRNGNINGDNSVGGADFNALRAAWGSNSASANWNRSADLNGDGSVGGTDLNILREFWSQSGDN